MKGIVLAGGSGTRLYPMTRAVSKHLLPVYDKPMVHYPIATLMLAGIRDVLIISTPHDLPLYERLLGSGEALGMNFRYQVQDKPEGLPQAFTLGESFLDGGPATLALGDGLFHGEGFARAIQAHVRDNQGATVFASHVSDPERYGVAAFDSEGNLERIVEKPKNPPSNWAVTGLYVYDESVVEKARTLKPSARGELEISDLNNLYLAEGRLKLVKFSRGTAWLDMGTPDAMLEASNFVAALQRRQGEMVACLEEVAWRMGFVDDDGLRRLHDDARAPHLRAYLRGLMEAA